MALSGQIDEKDLPELQALIALDARHKDITLDLEEVRLVDREAVGYLAACEANGIELKNCPAYVRKWLNARSAAFAARERGPVGPCGRVWRSGVCRDPKGADRS